MSKYVGHALSHAQLAGLANAFKTGLLLTSGDCSSTSTPTMLAMQCMMSPHKWHWLAMTGWCLKI
ncbi:hypothetical protein [Undibacterium macrobrachii]|uniref:hypothetical protein n=1 Tax=Undibacterium macrobrachii TaxID=1119058 RepID=UPI00167BFDC1|nr:hypothetical protein [Undibacterium macrobrachii]